jgi:hypothetical protein
MIGMGDQWAVIIRSRIPKLNAFAAVQVAEVVKDEMLENTLQGRSFGDEVYEPDYSPAYAKRRVISPTFPQLSPVKLRNKDLSLETANVVFDGRGGMISFVSKGNIFRYHHDGTAKGKKMRTIFPKRVQNVPQTVKLTAYRAGKAVLSGK